MEEASVSGKIQEEAVTSWNNNYSGLKNQNQNQNHCVSETEHLGFPRLLSSSGLRSYVFTRPCCQRTQRGR